MKYKFRAWDLDNNEMYFSDYRNKENHDNTIAWEFTGLGILFKQLKIHYPPNELTKSAEYIQPNQKLMAFSGFVDKNKKEVYEGDIVEAPLGRFVIEFKKGAFVRRSIFINVEGEKVSDVLDPIHTLYSTGGFESVEVIGNIHENKELLNF